MPNVIIHEVLNGNKVDGDLPDGTAATVNLDAPSYGGQTNLISGCTKAGRIDAGERGFSLLGVIINLPNSGGFTLEVVDNVTPMVNSTPADVDFRAQILSSANAEFTESGRASTNNFHFSFKRPILIPPHHSLEFKGSNALNEVGRLYFIIEPAFNPYSTGFVQVKHN